MTKHTIKLSFYKKGAFVKRAVVGDIIEIVADEYYIDPSAACGTHIPMRFSDDTIFGDLGYLNRNTMTSKFESDSGQAYKSCQFDMGGIWVSWGKHVHWYNGVCPFPDGIEYEIINRNGDQICSYNLPESNWEHDGDKYVLDVIAFRATGIMPNWAYKPLPQK